MHIRNLAILIMIMAALNVAVADSSKEAISKLSVSLSISGEQKKFTNTMQNLLKTEQLACDVPRWKIKETLDNDIQVIQKAARAYGYYHVIIERDVTQVDQCWTIKLNLLEGMRTIIKEVDIKIVGSAKSDSEFVKAIQIDQIKMGDPLLHARYEQQKKRIETIAAKRGYFDGLFTIKQLKVDPTKNNAYIQLHYQSGDRYDIGELLIEQNALREDLFNKYIRLKSGIPFNDADLVSTYQGLSASGYFSTVDVTPALDQRKENKVPILIKVGKSKPKSYSIGIGASTDTGPRLRASHQNRLFNERGHSYSTELSLSPVISNLGFSYRVPGEKPNTDFYEFNTRLTHEDTDSSTSDTFNMGIAQSRLLSHDWSRLISLQYSIDDFDVGEDNDTTSLLRPSLGFSTTQANSLLRPTKGYRINLELTGANSSLLSDIDFTQAKLNAKYVHGVGSKFRLLSRIDLGYTETNDFDELPSNLRFFAGGDASIRGYDYESLGPTDDADDVVGGEALIIGSMEMDYLFQPNWAGALFIDTGNAFNDNQIDLNVGAGFGLRWHSPIGPIRVDIGIPVDDPDADDKWRLHFSLGPDL